MKIKYKLFIISILIIFLFIIYINKVFLSITPSSLERNYIENRMQITALCQYLNSEQFNTYDIVRIDIFDSIIRVDCAKKDSINGGYIDTVHTITDSSLIYCIESLKKHGYIRILKEYNYIYFQTKSSFNESIGIIYSPKSQPELSEIKARKQTLKKLKNDGWYYIKTVYD